MTEEIQLDVPWKGEPTVEINELGNGTYELILDGSPVVKIDWLHGQRVCRWQVYGPADLTQSIALMKGFLHMVALIGNEQRAYKPPPKSEVRLEKLQRRNEDGKIERRPKSTGTDGKIKSDSGKSSNQSGRYSSKRVVRRANR